jgi:hypothetical protein
MSDEVANRTTIGAFWRLWNEERLDQRSQNCDG